MSSNYQQVDSDRSKIETCCGCVNMYTGFKCLAWINAIFCSLGLLGSISAIFILKTQNKDEIRDIFFKGDSDQQLLEDLEDYSLGAFDGGQHKAEDYALA